jgi:hypothetical protein
MDTEVKVRWVSALESGAYEQGRAKLCTVADDGKRTYCCLGVLCQLYLGLPEYLGETPSYNGEIWYLPRLVQERAGLIEGSPSVALSDEDFALALSFVQAHSSKENLTESRDRPDAQYAVGSVALAALNDAGVPFSEIARLIRKYL